MSDRVPDAVAVWTVYARHLGILHGAAGGARQRGDGWFAVLTGEPNADLNLAALFGPASLEDVDRLLAVAESVGGPLTLVRSQTMDPTLEPALRAGGLLPIERTEALMWLPSARVSEVSSSPFQVRRARSPDDLAAAADVLEAAHGFPTDHLSRIFDLEALAAGRLGCWIAWDGAEAAAIGWLTMDGPWIGVFEMMTAPAHRRRGAARAVLTTAMDEAADDATEGFFLWASPMGRPLYASLGYTVVDEVTVWVRGVSAADLARIGAVLPG